MAVCTTGRSTKFINNSKYIILNFNTISIGIDQVPGYSCVTAVDLRKLNLDRASKTNGSRRANLRFRAVCCFIVQTCHTYELVASAVFGPPCCLLTPPPLTYWQESADSMGLETWSREIELREKEVELMLKLQRSFNDEVAAELEMLRSEMRAYGISTDNRLKHQPLAAAGLQPEPGEWAPSALEAPAPAANERGRRSSIGSRRPTPNDRTGSKAATLAAVSSYFARKDHDAGANEALPVPTPVTAAPADLLFAALDKYVHFWPRAPTRWIAANTIARIADLHDGWRWHC